MTTMPRASAPGTIAVTAKYDAWNRLVIVSAAFWGQLQANEYDGLHRRIVRNGDSAGPLLIANQHRHFYYNERWQELEERIVVSGTLDPDPVNQYVWHPYYVDGLAVRYYDADVDGNLAENNDGRHWHLQDANFNVTGVANDGGTFLERYRYSAYGEPSYLEADFSLKGSQLNSTIGNDYLYTGRKRDAATGLYDFRTRFYHAPLGRFTSRDWIEYGGGMNLYAYVGGMPTGWVDPWGFRKCGPMVWLYTGSWCVEDNVWNAAVGAAGDYYLENAGDAHQALQSLPHPLAGATSEALAMVEGEQLHNAAMAQAQPAPPQQLPVPLPPPLNPNPPAPPPPNQNWGQQVNQGIKDWGPFLIYLAILFDNSNGDQGNNNGIGGGNGGDDQSGPNPPKSPIDCEIRDCNNGLDNLRDQRSFWQEMLNRHDDPNMRWRIIQELQEVNRQIEQLEEICRFLESVPRN